MKINAKKNNLNEIFVPIATDFFIINTLKLYS